MAKDQLQRLFHQCPPKEEDHPLHPSLSERALTECHVVFGKIVHVKDMLSAEVDQLFIAFVLQLVAEPAN